MVVYLGRIEGDRRCRSNLLRELCIVPIAQTIVGAAAKPSFVQGGEQVCVNSR